MSNEQIVNAKILGEYSTICFGAEEYIPILSEVQDIGYDEKPDYSKLKRLLMPMKKV